MTVLERFIADEEGLETVEYAIVAGVVAAGLVAVVIAIGIWVKSQLHDMKSNLNKSDFGGVAK